MNSPPNIFDLAFNPPPPDSSSIFPGLTGSRLAVPQRATPAQSRDRPRLPSPRLFRGIFADANGGSQSVQPDARRLPLLRERGDVDIDPAQLAGAITRTSRAVDSVQAAFQPRRSGRNRAVVDLTGSSPLTGPRTVEKTTPVGPPPLAQLAAPAQHRAGRARRRAPAAGEPRGLAADPGPHAPAAESPCVDSSSAVDALLARQRADAVLSQHSTSATENGRTRLAAYKCPVCMETPVNATTTICGHLFCHQCIIETLQWSAKQRDGHAPGGRKKCGMCPVCRKLLSIKDAPGTGRTLVPLELRFLIQKRKAVQSTAHDPKGKAKATDDAYADGVPPPSKKLKRETRETTDDQLWESYINHDLVGTT
ncbi:hypothetical protein DV736_g3054, partial [Chaetothyriales sp. CBS 134916]